MPRLFSIYELRELMEITTRDIDADRPRGVVRAGTACQEGRSNNVIRAAKRRILADGLIDRPALRVTGCHGLCEMEPVVIVEPENTVYTKVQPEDVGRITDTMTTSLSPVEVITENGAVTGIESIRNQLGDRDASGRRRPEPIAGTGDVTPDDTLGVAIGEQPDIDHPVVTGPNPPTLSPEKRRFTFEEAVTPLAMDRAKTEAARWLRCDLDCTETASASQPQQAASGGKS